MLGPGSDVRSSEALETTQFLFRMSCTCCVTVGDALGLPEIRSNGWGQRGPRQLGHPRLQCPQPTLGLRRSRDSAINRSRDCEEVPRSQGRGDPVSLGPWALGDLSPGFAFASLLPKSSLSWQQVPRL